MTSLTCRSPYPQNIATLGLASFAFARHYSRNLGWFLFLRLLRCFSSAGSLCYPMYSDNSCTDFLYRVSPFGYLRILRLFAPPRSLSQLVASFFGSWCQGILLVLFLAWTSFAFFLLHELRKSVLLNCNLFADGFPSVTLLTFGKTFFRFGFFFSSITSKIFRELSISDPSPIISAGIFLLVSLNPMPLHWIAFFAIWFAFSYSIFNVLQHNAASKALSFLSFGLPGLIAD